MSTVEGADRPRTTATVVVPVRNGEATLPQLLAALRDEVSAPGRELLVIDNGSTDSSASIARDAGVTVLSEDTPGPSAARNRGLREAESDVVAHIDADVVPTRGWLDALLAPFDDPSVTIVAGRTLSYPPSTGPERYIAQSGLLEVDRAVSRDHFPFAPSGNMAVRRDVALEVGGWDESLLTAEDVDFSHRILRAHPDGLAYQPDAVALHRNRSTDSALRRQAYTYGEGAARIYRKYPDVIGWNAGMTARLALRLAWRAGLPLPLRAGRALRLVSTERLEFARYHRLWSLAFWRGFRSAHRGRQTPVPT